MWTYYLTAGIILSTISDHFPSFISLNIKQTSSKIPKFVTISRYTSEAAENIRGDLIAENISLKICPPHENNPNLMYDIFENCITKIKQKHMPCISVKLKNTNTSFQTGFLMANCTPLKLNFRKYPAIHTNYITPQSTTL